MIQFRDQLLMLDILDAPAAPLRESISDDYLGELADSMATTGLLQPIGARGPSPLGRYEVVWGDCRTRAARMLNWDAIPARVCAWDVSPGEARAAENLHRADLNPREEAREVARLRAEGQPMAAIARTLRRSVGWVESRVELLTWPADIQNRVADGSMTMSAGRLLAEIDHEGYRASLIEEARRTGASSPVISVWLAHYQADRDRIIRNDDTVTEIMNRRETFRVMFECACCYEQHDTTDSVLLRVCGACSRALEDQRKTASQNGGTRPVYDT